MTLFEVDEAANRIRKEVDPDATIIFGSAFDDKLDGIMRVSVVATGISGHAASQPRPAAAPIAASASMRPQTSTILPNPLAGFMATASQPAIAEPAPHAVAAPAADRTRTADSPNVAPAPSGDVATAISNEIAGDAIEAALARVEADDDRQLDIDEAISATTAAVAIDMAPMTITPESTAQAATADSTMVGDAPNMPLTAATDRLAETRPAFIPDAPAQLSEEETVATTDVAPVQRPSSLINKISGLWSSKPTSSNPAATQRSEPAIDEAANKEQIAISILDLSRPGDTAGPIRKPTGAPIESSEDDLDIPAFLRRQAN
jgi:cell division protein FtsZ